MQIFLPVFLKTTNGIQLAQDGGDVSVLSLLDLSSAFETSDRHILFYRLQSLYDISGTVLWWCESQLTGRTMAVSVNSQSSKPAGVFFGVPRDSVLGPMYPLRCLLCPSLLTD